MALPLNKTGPTAAVLAMIGYFCWPYLEGTDSGGRAPGPAKLPEITAALLAPQIDSATERDPFRITAMTHPGVAADAGPGRAGPSPQDAPSEAEITRQLSRLVLKATYIRGDQRAAFINGRLYMQGEPLAISESTDPPFVVAEVHADKVVIEHRGRTVELTYTDARPGRAGQERHE